MSNPERFRSEAGEVRVQCVGCGDAFGSGGRLQSAYCLSYRGGRYMLDFGATAMPGLARLGIRPEEIDAILISHYHGDHYGGVPFLLRYRQLNRIDRPLTITGPPGLADRLERALDAFFPPCRPGEAHGLADLREVGDGEEVRVGPISLRAFAADHRPATNPMALRLDLGGVTIGYSGDSAWNPGVEAAGREADLFIVEAYQRERVRVHMSVAELREHLPGLGCRQVLLTHCGREVLEDPPVLDDCVLASDGLELAI